MLLASYFALTVSTDSNCEQFKEANLCISKLVNLIDRQTVEDEVVCQELCQSRDNCSNFTFVENKYPLKNGEPRLSCYLWKRCISQVSSTDLKKKDLKI